MAQNDFIEAHIKKHGRPLDYATKLEKKQRRLKSKKLSQRLTGIKAIIHHEKNRKQKIQLKKQIKQKTQSISKVQQEAVPSFLLDRNCAKSLSDSVKEQRKSQSSKNTLPIARIKGVSEKEMFSVLYSGKRQRKSWKRVVTKPVFVSSDFTRAPPKFERFIRPMGLRYDKAHVSHPELKATFCLPILGVKKNLHSEIATTLGILQKGTVIEVDVSELGITAGAKVVWAKYAQITNHPENDGCVNALLLV